MSITTHHSTLLFPPLKNGLFPSVLATSTRSPHLTKYTAIPRISKPFRSPAHRYSRSQRESNTNPFRQSNPILAPSSPSPRPSTVTPSSFPDSPTLRSPTLVTKPSRKSERGLPVRRVALSGDLSAHRASHQVATTTHGRRPLPPPHTLSVYHHTLDRRRAAPPGTAPGGVVPVARHLVRLRVQWCALLDGRVLLDVVRRRNGSEWVARREVARLVLVKLSDCPNVPPATMRELRRLRGDQVVYCCTYHCMLIYYHAYGVWILEIDIWHFILNLISCLFIIFSVIA